MDQDPNNNKKDPDDNDNFGRNLFFWFIIILLLVGFFNMFQQKKQHLNADAVAYSDFVADADAGRISDISIQGEEITGRYVTGKTFLSYIPTGTDVVSRIEKTSVRISAKPIPQEKTTLMSVLISWFPMLLLIGVWIFFMRQMNGSNNKAMGFGKSKARLLSERLGRITFDDVAGIDEAKVELEEIVEFLKDPRKFQRLGGKIPKGALLVGPPGTGKTLIARAVAGEADVPFFTISGSDFVEMFVGVGASRVRDMFEQGKRNAPCIIFIDEIDAVGRSRGMGLGGGNDEREQTLNQLLVEMDGFEANEGVILIAATNRPDVLDPALLRPGRFDRQIEVPNPDINGREMILKIHMRKVPLAADVDAHVIARGTPGFSGAELANLINEAALLAARRGKQVVGMLELEDAKDKVMMGTERRSMAMSEDEKKLTAYHEAGHAIIALHEPASDPIHKATIIPRGRALGLVMRLPESDRISMSREKLWADISVSIGGRLAEELIFGHDKVTTGASSDIQNATYLARHMVTDWGLSDDLGFLSYETRPQHRNISDETANKIDEEVRKIIDTAYKRAEKILKDNMDELHALAKGLLEYETLDGEEIKKVIAGKKIRTKNKTITKAKTKKKQGSVPTGGGSDLGQVDPEPQGA